MNFIYQVVYDETKHQKSDSSLYSIGNCRITVTSKTFRRDFWMELENDGSGENNTTKGKQILITPVIEMDQMVSQGTLHV